MTSIIDAPFAGAPGLTLADDATLESNLAAAPGLYAWFRAEDAFMTITSGRVERINSRVTSACYLYQPTAANQPVVAATPADQGGWPAIFFDGTSRFMSVVNPPNFATPYVVAVVFKPTAFDADRCLFGMFTGGGTSSFASIGTDGRVQFAHASSSVYRQTSLDVFNVGLFGSDTAQAFGRVNGSELFTVHDNNISPTSVYIGALNVSSRYMKGYISDILIFNTADPFTNRSILDWIEEMARQECRVTFVG